MNVEPPYALLAELTHACPLRCTYCSNPVQLQNTELELSIDEWSRVVAEAADIGVLQIHFSGGEPLIRHDLEEIVSVANGCGLYSNLITSGMNLNEIRMQSLLEAGLKSVQISVQDSDANIMAEVIGAKALATKLDACAAVRKTGLPLCINIVLHRHNIARIEELVLQAVDAGALRIELANVQYHGWALLNRQFLIPTREQVQQAQRVAMKLRLDFPQVEIIYVLPDYFQEFPKPCMGGWGRVQLTIDPIGTALPCPAAKVINNLMFPSVRENSLKTIWFESDAFNAFRGNNWMLEPCRSCERQDIDYGGCRCQAFMIAGDARYADPVCKYSEHRHVVEQVLSNVTEVPVGIFRSNLAAH